MFNPLLVTDTHRRDAASRRLLLWIGLIDSFQPIAGTRFDEVTAKKMTVVS